MESEINRYASIVERVRGEVPSWLSIVDKDIVKSRVREATVSGLPRDVAHDIADLLDLYGLLDVVEIVDRTGEYAGAATELYYTLKDRITANTILDDVSALDRTDRWNALARMGPTR